MPRFLRFGWDEVDATLIDQRLVRRDAYRSEHSTTNFQVWEYMVELPGPEGDRVRLAFEEKSFKVDLPQVGGTVPVLVNRSRTKAMFDLDDPRIDAIGKLEAKQKARKARQQRDKERFDKKLAPERRPGDTTP